MTFVEIMDLFAFYGADVIVLAVIVTALTQVLKVTLLKNVPQKFYTFLPYILGAALYAAYAAVAHMNANYFAEHIADVFNRGISVGAVATIIYALIKQIKSGETPDEAGVVAEMLKGFVVAGKEKDVAADLLRIIGEDNDLEKARSAVKESGNDITDAQTELLLQLILKTLRHDV